MLWNRGILDYPLSLHCHHQNDSCIRIGSDESHFKISFIMRGKVTRQCPQTTTSEEGGEPKRNRTEVILLTSLTPYRWAKPAHKSLPAMLLAEWAFKNQSLTYQSLPPQVVLTLVFNTDMPSQNMGHMLRSSTICLQMRFGTDRIIL